MPILTLHGCPPEPLGNYLKALGIFRLVAEQADPQARAWWQDGVMRLQSRFSSEENLVRWFRWKYRPSPHPSPWSVHSGWWPPGAANENEEKTRGDKRGGPFRVLRKLAESDLSRFASFRTASSHLLKLLGESKAVENRKLLGDRAKELLKTVEAKDARKKQRARATLLRLLRNTSPDALALRWFDAAAVLGVEADGAPAYFPILGDGALEGANSFAGNYYKFLSTLVPVTNASGFWESDAGKLSWGSLRAALLNEPSLGQQARDAAGGFYFPNLMEAPNVGQKFVADPKKRVNPWDFILAMEGVLFWSVAAVRRLETHGRSQSSFPFFCDSAVGGNAALGPTELAGGSNAKTRGELWLPLWDKPATCGEIERLLVEGRVSVAGRTATRATEFAVGVASLGHERGIASFIRTGLLQRSGSGDNLTTLAVPLGHWTPRRLKSAELLAELTAYQGELARLLVVHNGQPRRLVLARESFESSLIEFSAQRDEAPGSLLPVLVAASLLECELGVTCGVVKLPAGERKVTKKITRPLASLDRRWQDLLSASDRQPGVCSDLQHPNEFKLALAVASILPWGASSCDPRQPAVGTLRTNLLPVIKRGRNWAWDGTSRAAVWSRGASLESNLAAVLHRRLVDAQRGPDDGLPLWSFYGADFTDLLALWRGELDETRLTDLIHALALVDFGSATTEAVTAHQVKRDPTPDLGSVAFDYDHPERDLPPSCGGISSSEVQAAFALPRAYALLKLCFTGGTLPAAPVEKTVATRSGNEPFPNPPLRILNLLLAGRGPEALETATQFLRAKGLATILRADLRGGGNFTNGEDWLLSSDESRRLAGLLLIPVRRAGVLAALSLKPKPN